MGPRGLARPLDEENGFPANNPACEGPSKCKHLLLRGLWGRPCQIGGCPPKPLKASPLFSQGSRMDLEQVHNSAPGHTNIVPFEIKFTDIFAQTTRKSPERQAHALGRPLEGFGRPGSPRPKSLLGPAPQKAFGYWEAHMEAQTAFCIFFQKLWGAA